MRIKRYEAKDTTTALAMIKNEMGEDAVILATRSLAKKHGNTRMVEVVAAMDYDMDEIGIEASRQCETTDSKTPYGYHTLRAKSKNSTSVTSSTSTRPLIKTHADEQTHSEAHDMRVRFAAPPCNRTHSSA